MSIDGRLDWFDGDIGLYYQLADHWGADAMLSGSNTVLVAHAQEEPDEGGEPLEWSEDASEPRLLHVVVDSRGRIRTLHRWRRTRWWRDTIALCSRTTPRDHLDYLAEHGIEAIVAGDERVDLRAALEELNARHGVEVIRVDSGGILNGVLLRAGLVDEVSVILHPSLTGGTTPRSMFVAPDLASGDGVIGLRLAHVERVRGDAVWLRYEVKK
jgi:2,5-diamino-6-(ribosylamino)-4(3H)-pyrimidinone 5'-phosphate reductase